VALTADPTPLQPRLPFPSFLRIQGVTFGEDAWFDGLSLKAEKRTGHGLSFLASYTWSKSLDTGSTIEAWAEWTDPLRQKQTAKGPSYYDVSQHLALSFQYELPVGRGKALGGRMSGGMNRVVGGWGIRGISTLQGGFPYDPTMSLARTNICESACTARPDQIRNANLPKSVRTRNGLSSDPTVAYWDYDAFVLPPVTAPRIGNAGRGVLRGPGVNNWDLGIFKNVAITERLRLEFRYEMFNAWNHPQFNSPSTDLEDRTTFGKLTSAHDPRISQFVLKVSF
jgi:hypothetical protein